MGLSPETLKAFFRQRNMMGPTPMRKGSRTHLERDGVPRLDAKPHRGEVVKYMVFAGKKPQPEYDRMAMIQRVHGVQANESSSGHGIVNANGSGLSRAPSYIYPTPRDRDEGHLDATPNISAVSYAGACIRRCS